VLDSLILRSPVLAGVKRIMKFIYVLLILFVSTQVMAKKNSQDPEDLRNLDSATLACKQLGSECEKYMKECAVSGTMPNTCLSSIYFELEVAKERCGLMKHQYCYEQNIKYKKKWMHELNIPNIGNAKRNVAFEKCDTIASYKVKSEHIAEFEADFIRVFEGVSPPFYTDYEKYYECFKTHLN